MKDSSINAEESLETVIFNDQNTLRWKVLMQSDDPKAREAATELLQDIRSVLGLNLTAITDAARVLRQEINDLTETAKEMRVDLPRETLH